MAPGEDVQVLYFASLRDRLGRGGERLALPPAVRRVDALVAWMGARDPALAALLAEGGAVRVAVNQSFAHGSDPVAPGDEVAFLPPVTGG